MINDQYLPMEVNMMSDERICTLISKEGLKGVGAYVILLLELRKKDDYRASLNSLEILGPYYGMRRSYFRKIITGYNLFDIENVGEETKVISPYVNKAMTKLDAQRASNQAKGKRGAAKRWNFENSPAISPAIAEYNNIIDRSIEVDNKQKENTSTNIQPASINFGKIKPWTTLLDEAVCDHSWVELLAKRSGLGLNFMKYRPEIITVFKEHVIARGTDTNLTSTRQVKEYLYNFLSPGSVTQKRVAQHIQDLEEAARADDPYRYETVDPVTGQRMYSRRVIPPTAPPRPHRQSVWSDELQQWSR